MFDIDIDIVIDIVIDIDTDIIIFNFLLGPGMKFIGEYYPFSKKNI